MTDSEEPMDQLPLQVMESDVQNPFARTLFGPTTSTDVYKIIEREKSSLKKRLDTIRELEDILDRNPDFVQIYNLMSKLGLR